MILFLQIINPKPLELDSWHFERIFTHHHMSHVTCHISRVTCQVSDGSCQVSGVRCPVSFFWQLGGASRLRVCYQRGLPRLVFIAPLNLFAKAFILDIALVDIRCLWYSTHQSDNLVLPRNIECQCFTQVLVVLVNITRFKEKKWVRNPHVNPLKLKLNFP